MKSAVSSPAATLPALRPTACPVGCPAGRDEELYPANFFAEDLTADLFSARRRPDRIHYRMVRCGHCGLVRSDPILSEELIARLYAQSHFTYQDTARYTASDYRRYLLRHVPARGRLLEIGCGNGFFLEHCLMDGFEAVAGVEPSEEAVALAPPAVRPFLQTGLFSPDLFEAHSFDAVAGFQVLDHFTDPAGVLEGCRQVLKPGGHALFICHNLSAAPGRWLGERNPMVDIEHIHLFDPKTIARLFEKKGFVVQQVFAVSNQYPLSYWAHLAPLPGALKKSADTALRLSGLGRMAVRLRMGNLGIHAVSP